MWCGQCGGHLTQWALDGVDGLLPARLLLWGRGQTVVLIQMQLEPHSQGVQYALLGHCQIQPAHVSGAQTLQLLWKVKGQRHYYTGLRQ